MSKGKLDMQAGRPSNAKKSCTLADLVDQKATVRVNFDLDREEHIKLKIYAAKTGQSIADILRKLIASIN